jgi:copper oxidase (laccase) domain-containing protein
MADVLVPDWPAPANVRALQTLRSGGCSPAPWNSLNLGDHVGDSPANVAANRAALRDHLPAEPLWLVQVHGNATVDAEKWPKSNTADASYSRQPGWFAL